MRFVETPNLPEAKVGLVIIDGRIDRKIENTLNAAHIEFIKTGRHRGVDEAISYHPDIMLHHLGDQYMLYSPGTPEGTLEKLREYGLILIEGQAVLKRDYPGDIPYNAARVGRYVFHNSKFTDPVLRYELEKRGVEFIDIKQGYSKCSICVIDEKSIITSDKGILKAAEAKGIEALLIEQEENILLRGFEHGFIGGSTGLLNRNKLAVSGKAELLKSYYKISGFVEKRGLKLVSLSEEDIWDIGSIMPIMIL